MFSGPFFLSLTLTPLTTGSPLISRATLIEAPDHPAERRGVAFNNPECVKPFDVEGTHVRWTYNWDSQSEDTGTWFEYVPMLWSNHDDHTGRWLANAKKAAGVIEKNPTHFLGFNEPDVCTPDAGGSCMSITDSVRAWRAWMEPTKDYKDLMYFGSPAVSNSGDPDKGLNYLRDFLNLCSGCKIDFICIHWYDDATSIQYFKDHINAARQLAAGRPIWVTEFMARGTDDQVKRFMDEIIPWLDESSDIHRYAYFMAQPSMLIDPQGKNLSDVGRHYTFWRKSKNEAAKPNYHVAEPKFDAVKHVTLGPKVTESG